MCVCVCVIVTQQMFHWCVCVSSLMENLLMNLEDKEPLGAALLRPTGGGGSGEES